jgi:hypothetical protein
MNILSRKIPAWVLVFAIPLCLLSFVGGLGASYVVKSTSRTKEDSKKESPKSYISVFPVNKSAFEPSVLGRSTKEINDILGSPSQVIETSGHITWLYRCPRDDKGNFGNVGLQFRNDAVFHVSWY